MLTVFITRDGFVQKRAQLWHRAWCFGMCSKQSWIFLKNPVVTNSSSPTFLGPVGAGVSSQAWHRPWFGSKPKHSQGHLLSLTPEHHHFPEYSSTNTSRDAENTRVCFQLITSTYKDSQAVTQNLLYWRLQVFLAAAHCFKSISLFFLFCFSELLRQHLTRIICSKRKAEYFLNNYFHLEDTTFLCPHLTVQTCLHRWGLCHLQHCVYSSKGQGHGVSFMQRHQHNNEKWEHLHIKKENKHCTKSNSSSVISLNWRRL